MHHCNTKFQLSLARMPVFLKLQAKEEVVSMEEEEEVLASFWTAGYLLIFRSLENRTMEGCPHAQAVYAKDCLLCRVKRAVCIKQRIPALRKAARHQSQECLPSMPKKQSLISLERKEKTAYRDGCTLTETNYSLWIKKMQQKRLKTQPRLKMDYAEIDWSLFGQERHRPKFDRWESKLVVRLARNGHWEELMRNMSLF